MVNSIKQVILTCLCAVIFAGCRASKDSTVSTVNNSRDSVVVVYQDRIHIDTIVEHYPPRVAFVEVFARDTTITTRGEYATATATIEGGRLLLKLSETAQPIVRLTREIVRDSIVYRDRSEITKSSQSETHKGGGLLSPLVMLLFIIILLLLFRLVF